MAQYILVERTSQRSVQNGVTMWRLTFYSLADGQLYEMTVDPTYRNFRRQGWDHVVESECPWAVYTGITRTARHTRTGMPVVTADRAAEVVYRCESHQQALELVAADQRERAAVNTRASLFE